MRKLDLSPEEFEATQFGVKSLTGAPVHIDDGAALTVNQLRARCRRLRLRNKIQLVVVDYLQLMRGSQSRRDNREQEVAEISRGLKSIARELKIPVIVLSQLNRSAEKRENEDKRPQLSDLRESGAIEQDADVVLMLYRPDYYNTDASPSSANTCEVLVRKNRNGPMDDVRLTYQKDIYRFSNYIPEHG